MPGFFYPPPPARIGGSQPYAPKLGLVQSGPTPQAPPLRGPLALAVLTTLVGSWTPPYVRAQGSPTIAPLIPAPIASAQVPYSRYAQQRTIADSWIQPQIVSLAIANVAPLLATPPQVDNAPVSTTANLNVLLRSWQPGPPPAQGYAEIAPLIPAPAITPNPSYTRKDLALALWAPQSNPQQYRPFIASLPIVNDPPRSSTVNANTILQSWVPPYLASQGYADIAPLVPAAATPDQPPIPGYANLRTVIASWIPPWQPPQGFSEIAPVLPRVDNAPTRTLINYELIGRQWQPAWFGPAQVDIAPLIPIVVTPDNPPPSSFVNRQTILQAWIPPYFEAQGFSEIAPTATRVDAPPPSSWVNFNTVAKQWPVRWTIPEQVRVAGFLYVPPTNSTSQQIVTVNAEISVTVFGPLTTQVNG